MAGQSCRGCFIGSRGGKEGGALERLKTGETRETGTRWLGTDGVSASAVTFKNRWVNGEGYLVRGRSSFGRLLGGRIDVNLLVQRRNDLDGFLRPAGALQLGFDGNPRSLYLCSE